MNATAREGQVFLTWREADTPAGTSLLADVTVTDGSTDPVTAQVPVTVVASTRPLIQVRPIEIPDAEAGVAEVVDIADHMCGVVKRRVDELLEAGLPAVIARDVFYGWYTSYLRKIDRDTVLLSRAKPPSEEESCGLLPKIFVQQLDLIGLPFEDKLEAVSDYLMAAADRTNWALSGEVDASSFDDLDAALKRSWKNKRRACGIEHGSKPGDLQGQMLYSDCIGLTLPLQAMQPPDHFIPGCFHWLADDMSIGWHPDFEQQLKIKKAA